MLICNVANATESPTELLKLYFSYPVLLPHSLCVAWKRDDLGRGVSLPGFGMNDMGPARDTPWRPHSKERDRDVCRAGPVITVVVGVRRVRVVRTLAVQSCAAVHVDAAQLSVSLQPVAYSCPNLPGCQHGSTYLCLNKPCSRAPCTLRSGARRSASRCKVLF